MKRRFIALLCLALLLCSLMPTAAAADSAIEKLLCTTSSIPVAQMDSRDIYVATSTAGCYVEDYTWRRTSDGSVVYQNFGKENVEISITLRAMDGWFFSDACAVYLNNSSAGYYIGDEGRTLTLSRTYAPELWAPSIIKHPGNENVEEGGLASFVATATLTKEYKWYIVDPVSGDSYSVYEIPGLFEGSTIGGDGESKLNIYHVTAAMDGWQLYCVFSGPGGEVKSQKATLKVKYETPPPTETPEPTPEATPEPSAAPEAAEAKPDESADSAASTDHAHSFSDVWRTDSTLHWHECACGAKSNEGSHILSWTKIKEATRREKGLSEGRCETCGYTVKKDVEYNSANNVLRYAFFGLGGLVGLTIIVLIIDSIRQNRRRRRRRKARRR